MTTIAEEDEGRQHLAPIDFQELLADVTFGEIQQDHHPLHPSDDNGLGLSNAGIWTQIEDQETEETVAPLAVESAVVEPDYSQFQNWIPKFVWPDKPCDHCQSKRLNCYAQRGEPKCAPCTLLSSQCSLSKSQTLEATNYASKDLDTLHVVHEDNARQFGTWTGIEPSTSKDDTGSNSVAPVKDDAPGSSKRNGIRFPRQAVKVLRDWLDTHADNPYPSEEEKAELERQTELKPSQIANWLANARRRRKVTEKSKPKLCMSPSLRPTTSAIAIPSAADKPWDELNPFERWQHSPPEHEPADLENIVNALALARNEVPSDSVSRSPSTLSLSRRRKGSSNGTKSRAPSTTSQETGQTSSLSASSARYSNGSSHSTHGSFGSFSSSLAGKKDRRRRRRPAMQASSRKPTDDKKRIFQCTFCTDTFKSKYDWTRHEKSLHLSLEKWICAPLGPLLTDIESGNKKCVYCDLHNPSSDHLDSHNHQQCEDKGLDARTFYRKDHLRQHLRLMHGCEMSPAMDSWKSIAANINSRCGFCAQRFTVWQERVDHLTAHFKAGSRMLDWKGCRGLDPAVAAQVTNAMPPYLIGIESVSPNPFSATNRATWRELPGSRSETDACNKALGMLGEDSGRHSDILDACAAMDGYGPIKATCWEILTVRLGKYAKEMADQGVQITDDMLQKQARLVLYDNDDTWNQTAADNPEWLDLFKKAHGLDYIPSAVGGQGSQVPEDLVSYGIDSSTIEHAFAKWEKETYGDLGLRIPFAVQLQAYNQRQTGQQITDAGTRPGPYQLNQQAANMLNIHAALSQEGVLKSGEPGCKHPQCAGNFIDISSIDESNAPGAQIRSWCTAELSSDIRERVQSGEGSPGNGARGLGSLFALDAQQTTQAAASRFAALEKMARMHSHDSCDDPKTNCCRGNHPRQSYCFTDRPGVVQARNDNCSPEVAHTLGLEALSRNECAVGRSDCATGRFQGLKALDRFESNITAREWLPSDLATMTARARSHGLQTLSALESPEPVACDPPRPTKKPYLQRHRYELPKETVNMFATTTGAWEDSGLMPQTVDTCLPNISETATTSTGAMMEFFGPSVDASLPFANDALTSQIPLPNLAPDENLDWAMLNNGDVTQEELDEFINATTVGEHDGGFTTGDIDMSWMDNPSLMTDSLPMQEAGHQDFDEMMFDMPLDEAFGINDAI